ncbi:MAG TPA: hypothetical protein DCQ06_12160 [Myxococcales bacterium]|nr:hypothetical protein [Myxococcales bacterium]
MQQAYRYAGWLLIDLRLTTALIVFSAALGVLVLSLGFRAKRWDQYVSAFVAVFSLTLLVSLALTNWLARHPALSIESIFSVP